MRLRSALPEGTPCLHWGDIDLGGFRILAHLKRETGIPFEPLWMDTETLRRRARYATPLTEPCRKQLRRAREDPQLRPFQPVLDAMLEDNVRLEQETVRCRSGFPARGRAADRRTCSEGPSRDRPGCARNQGTGGC